MDFFGRGLLVRLDRDQFGVLAFAVVSVFAGTNNLGNQFPLFPQQKDNPAIGFDVFKHEVHDHFHDLINSKAASQRRSKLIQNLEIGHRHRGRLGDGQDHRIIRG